MEERQSVIGDALGLPVTTGVILVLVVVWYQIWSNRVPASSYAYNYKDFKAGEHWRILSAAMAHESPLHLLFNVSPLWSVRHIEREFGSVFFLNYSLVLMIFSKVLMNGIHGLIISRGGQQRYYVCAPRCTAICIYFDKCRSEERRVGKACVSTCSTWG